MLPTNHCRIVFRRSEDQNDNDRLPKPGCNHVLLFRILDCRNLYLGSAVVGLSYGACLSLFRPLQRLLGDEESRLNYGIMFTAWVWEASSVPSWRGKSRTSPGAIISDISYQRAYALWRSADLVTSAKEKRVVGSIPSLADHPAASKVGWECSST